MLTLMRNKTLLTLLVLPAALAGQSIPRRAMTFEDFASVRAVSDPQISPDGRTVLYTVRVADVPANRRTANTFAVPASGGAARQFPSADVSATEARWSPDGRRVAFIAGGQLWVSDADGGNRKQLTTLNGGATGPVWSPTGTAIAFSSTVFPQCSTDACNAAAEKARDTSKVKAHIAEQLLYRHWNAWDDATRSHLFVVPSDGGDAR